MASGEVSRHRPPPAGPRAAARALAVVAPPDLPFVAALAAAGLLWGAAVTAIDPRAMNDYGLVSVLPAAFLLALGLLTCSFAALVSRRPHRTALLAAHVVALVMVLHATPAVVYGTLRYSWAWKHLGIVDFIQRHDAVDPHAASLPIYHSWPGFFAAAGALQDLAGLDDLRGIATWAPPAFTLLAVGAVVLVVSSLTGDRRIVWLSAWLYVVVNWVGQEYFSPQALAFCLYLLIIGIVLRRLRPPATAGRWAPAALVVLLAAAVTATHLLTSVLTVLSLGALVLVRRCSVPALPLVAAALVAVWWSTVARDYVVANVNAAVDSIAPPWVTTEDNLVDAGALSEAQTTVVATTRLLVVVVVALAAVGLLRLWRRRAVDPALVALACVPALLFATGDYEGELIFRIYLFASPFLAVLAAHALPRPSRRSPGAAWPAATAALASVALLAGFLVAYYGKERFYYFTPQEIAAAERVYRAAPEGSLLIQGTRNVPVQFENYERLTYVTLSDESAATQREVIARPAQVLGDWMEHGGWSAAYVLITRSQRLDAAGLGKLPPGALEGIEAALARSPRFHVERLPDATIATLAEDGR